ncbi:hypothetical protein [Nocardiopsis sp. Huas11]|uniref:hypothetical protein n=1 Tax=Nocardiopsis sp. Huas11 TaxID=2183912 RepID=UPI0018F51CF0|nr:hypothetical protein [Nocardiopsis sp. Huas11]
MGMGEYRLEWDEKALTGPADLWFPWLKGQPKHIRAELQQLVATAEHAVAEWAEVREGLGNELRRLEADLSAPRGEVEVLIGELRGVVAGPGDPEELAGFAGAGRVSLAERARVYVVEGVGPGATRAENAIGRVRSGTERLSASLREMRGLAGRIEQARKGWAPSPSGERRPETVNRVMGDHPPGGLPEGRRRSVPDALPSRWRDRVKGPGRRSGPRSG